MTTWTKADTAKAISFLQLGYSTILTEARYTFYVEMLSDIPPLLVAVAVQKLINSSKFMPSIAEIRQTVKSLCVIAHQEGASDWTFAWQKLNKEIQRAGSYGHPEFDDPLLAETVRRMGWLNICQTPVKDISILRAQFRQVYEQLVNQSDERKEYEMALRQLTNNAPLPEIGPKLQSLNQKLRLVK